MSALERLALRLIQGFSPVERAGIERAEDTGDSYLVGNLTAWLDDAWPNLTEEERLHWESLDAFLMEKGTDYLRGILARLSR